MIITSAKQYVESDVQKRIGGPPNWKYLALRIGSDIFRIVFEHGYWRNGSSVRQWSINENTTTTVEDKFWREVGQERFVSCDVSSGLCGVRKFEHNSIAWEFLYKPMGLSFDIVEPYLKDGVTSYCMKEMLSKAGIDFDVLYDDWY